MQATATKAAEKIVQSNPFQGFILTVVLLAGILVGLETFPSLVKQYDLLFYILDRLIIWIFIGEFILRVLAEGKTPWRYFFDPWNLFDFLIIAVYFLPFNSHYVLAFRLVRLLRVLKLLRVLPRLQILTSALLRSIPSMIYVCLFLCLLFYIYGVAGTFLFRENDPFHFGTLPRSMLSLFLVVTLENWVDILYTQMYGCDRFGYGGMEELCTQPEATPIISVVFFLSFVLLGAMIVINLFIGVITNNIEESQQEQRDLEAKLVAVHKEDRDRIHAHLSELQDQVHKMQSSLDSIKRNLAGD